jgi:hypothetical protein
MPSLASPQAQHQSQGTEQTNVPVTADPSSSKSLSDQPAAVAQQSNDAIAPVTDASSLGAKDDATITVDSADPLGYARHRREDMSEKQLKAEHPLAKPRHMKVRHQLVLANLDLTGRRNSTTGKTL